jgi:hypothetical protein
MKRAVCWTVLIMAAAFLVPGSTLAQAPAGGASSELVSQLAKEIGATAKQAEGAAGSLFRLAKSRMTPENFGKVASAVPDMDKLLAAAPALDGKAAGAAAAIGQTVGKEGIGDLAAVTQSFRKLGLKGDAVKKAIPVLTDFVGKRSGGDLAKLLGESLH